MKRGRVIMWTGASVMMVVAIVAGGVFAIEYTSAFQACNAAAVAAGKSTLCTPDTPSFALDALFFAVFGLLAAIVMAVTAGVNWRTIELPADARIRLAELEERDRAQEEFIRRTESLADAALAAFDAEQAMAAAQAEAEAAAAA